MTRFSNLEFDNHSLEDLAEQLPREAGKDEHAYLLMGDEHYQNARFEKAMRYYSRTLEYNPNFLPGWVGQVRMLIELGENREALLWTDKALEIFPDANDLLAAKSVAHVRLAHTGKAMEFSDAALEQKHPTPYVWMARGEIMLACFSGLTGRRGKDEYCFTQALNAGGRDWFTTLQVARTYAYYRHFALALEFVRKALDLAPASPFIWFVMGEGQKGLGLYAQASKSYDQALTLDATFVPARNALESLKHTSYLGGIFRRLKGMFA
jgi:tetratricopeptide (TPR) repeat protein